ncbi:hypothetical protein Nepgr_008517 [Nepenthes gracilis]|uniref:Uncharacterized protein n=1 Tax=Nepenthes gracilis TaxID=150966 RepID=A0AAD3S9N7_NEPGR|nr:hypothetical protein Nepgr_008517 [Nepenthes gracilis]
MTAIAPAGREGRGSLLVSQPESPQHLLVAPRPAASREHKGFKPKDGGRRWETLVRGGHGSGDESVSPHHRSPLNYEDGPHRTSIASKPSPLLAVAYGPNGIASWQVEWLLPQTVVYGAVSLAITF